MNTASHTSATTRKLPAQFTQVVFAFYMSAIMSVLMCTVVTVINRGFSIELPLQVFQAYLLAFPIAFCCVLMVRPVVTLLVRNTVQTVPQESEHARCSIGRAKTHIPAEIAGVR